MAYAIITNHFAQGFANKASGTKFTWWKTSFNMPVRNIFDNSSIYDEYEWMLDSYWEGTSFDLSGFEAWWEVVWASTVFTLYWPFAWWTLTFNQAWKNTLGTTIFSSGWSAVFPSLATATNWSSYQLISNQWVASWEIDTSWTYNLEANITWAFTATDTFWVTFSNVPSVATYTPWMVWIEGNNLRWSSANWHLHTMVWTVVWTPWTTPWYCWIEWDYIMWIWSSGNKYRGQYNFRQFWSASINWPSPAVVSGQTPWMVWMDSNFWYEHIWYIAQDGYKWINNSWENPYI